MSQNLVGFLFNGVRDQFLTPIPTARVYFDRLGTTAGSRNPINVFTDSAGTTPAPNPVISDSQGRATVYLSEGAVVEIRDTEDNLIRRFDYPSERGGISDSLPLNRINIGNVDPLVVARTPSSIPFLNISGGSTPKLTLGSQVERGSISAYISAVSDTINLPPENNTQDVFYGENNQDFARIHLKLSGNTAGRNRSSRISFISTSNTADAKGEIHFQVQASGETAVNTRASIDDEGVFKATQFRPIVADNLYFPDRISAPEATSAVYSLADSAVETVLRQNPDTSQNSFRGLYTLPLPLAHGVASNIREFVSDPTLLPTMGPYENSILTVRTVTSSPRTPEFRVSTTGIEANNIQARGTLMSTGMATLDSLTVTNDATVTGSLINTGTFTASQATVSNLTVNTSATLNTTVTITGTAIVGSLTSSGSATVNSITVSGSASVGSLTVTGASSFDTLSTSGTASLNSLSVSDETTLGAVGHIGRILTANGTIFATSFVSSASSTFQGNSLTSECSNNIIGNLSSLTASITARDVSIVSGNFNITASPQISSSTATASASAILFNPTMEVTSTITTYNYTLFELDPEDTPPDFSIITNTDLRFYHETEDVFVQTPPSLDETSIPKALKVVSGSDTYYIPLYEAS